MVSNFHSRRDMPGSHPFVGRDRELAMLRDALERAIQGDGSLVLVSGVAGIGKTSLVHALVREAQGLGELVLTGGAYDLTSTPPYGPWIELTDHYPASADLPDLPEVLKRNTGVGDLQNQLELFEFVREFFISVAETRPLVLVLEDMHWSDEASLDLLRYISRRVQGNRILIVATYRSEEISRHHPLFQLLPSLVRESPSYRVELNPLTPEDIRALVESRWPLAPDDQARLLDHLLAHAEGNPLFTVEMLHTLEQSGFLKREQSTWLLADFSQVPVPALVQQVIERRLGHLADRAREHLEVAAVIGQHVPLDIWQYVTGMTDSELMEVVERAVELNLLEPSIESTAVNFVHALTRETLYDGVLPLRRRSWHRRIADVLSESSNPVPDTVAYHFEQAGDSRAVEWLVRAGIRARDQSAWLSAADRFALAAQSLQGDEQRLRERGWLLFYTGYLLRFSTGERSIKYLEEAEQAGLATGDDMLFSYALYCRGSTRSIRPTPEMRAGLAELRRGVEALEHLSGIHLHRSTDEHADAMIRALFTMSESENSCEIDPPVRVSQPILSPQRGVLISRLAQSGQYLESMKLGEEFVRSIDSRFGETWQTNIQCLDAYSGLGHDYAATGQPDAARRVISTARSAYLATNDQAMAEFMTSVELYMVMIPYLTDYLDERAQLASLASEAWSRCREITVSGGSVEAPAHLVIHELEGRWDHAWQIADQEQHWHPWKAYVAQATVTKGRLSRSQGDPETAWECVNRMLPDGPITEPGNCYFQFTFEALALAVKLCLDAGDPDQARAWIAARDRWLEWSGAQLWKAENFLLWASYFRAIGKFEEAHDYAVEALAEANDPRQPLTQLRVKRLLGEIGTALKRHEAAAKYFDEALSIAQACAAPYERALTLLGLAELHVSTGNLDAATTLIGEVRSICNLLNAQPALARAAALEAQIDGRVVPEIERTDKLTAREIEVLRLIAKGRSNRHIADELFISTRTVERHIANIYTKIHVHNRAEATGYALRNHLA